MQEVAKKAMCALLGMACSLSAAVVTPVPMAVHSAAFQAWAGSAVNALDPAGGKETADAPEALRGVLCGELAVCAWLSYGADPLLNQRTCFLSHLVHLHKSPPEQSKLKPAKCVCSNTSEKR